MYRIDVKALERGAVRVKGSCTPVQAFCERLVVATSEERKLCEMTGVRDPKYICTTQLGGS